MEDKIMKKTYINPELHVVHLTATEHLLKYSDTQAAENAPVFSREGSGFWDDDEVVYDED
jgi:hypothetical protein